MKINSAESLMLHTVNFSIILIVLCFLSSCSSVQKRASDRFFGVQATIAERSYGRDVSIEVLPFKVRGVEASRLLVIQISKTPVELTELKGNFWNKIPSLLLQQATVEAFSSSSKDAMFGVDETLENIDYRLKVMVHRFAFLKDGNANFVFHATLRDTQGLLVLTKKYNVSSNSLILEIDGANISEAFSEAISKGLNGLSEDIANAIN
ncbi:PqiC family protein [Alphaproteobacteria bacterium]|nr:PqiC family protein [Alphaproteobacteria bacterium]